MLTQEDVYDCLKQAFPAGAVSLVAKHQDDALQLPTRRAHIFIGDCHLLSERDSPSYPKWGFKQGADLLKLIEALKALKKDSPGQLDVWQLGDLFDIWRARGGLGPAREVDEICADHYEIIDLLRYGAPHGVNAKIIAGNHDYGLYQLAEWQAARYTIVQNADSNAGDMLLLHGDIFDWIEKLPDEIQERAVQFATWHSSGKKELFNEVEVIAKVNDTVPHGDKPIGKSKANLRNVIDGESGNPEAKNKRFYRGCQELAGALKERGHNIRLVVIGHTHWARIIKGKRSDGDPLAVLDCGAWIGSCKLKQDRPWLYSAQLGVAVGNDLRVYQVGKRRVP